MPTCLSSVALRKQQLALRADTYAGEAGDLEGAEVRLPLDCTRRTALATATTSDPNYRDHFDSSGRYSLAGHVVAVG